MPTKFQEKVYREVKKIKAGETKTYGQIASILHISPRAIGQALKANHNPKVPCHRVVGKYNLGGYNKGVKLKIKLLKKEGVKITRGKSVKLIQLLFLIVAVYLYL